MIDPKILRHHIDDVAKRHPSITGEQGTQCMKINEKILPLMFDGFKVFCTLRKTTPSDLKGKYPIYKLTSSQPYKPQERRYT